jgi:short-subunit dehydrogenase
MKSVIIGASAGLGRALAEELARHGHDLFLVASDPRDLSAIRSDLRIRYSSRVEYHAGDIRALSGAELRSMCNSKIGKADCLFLVSGQSDLDRDFEKLSEDEITRLVEVNFSAPVRIATAFLPDLLESRNGALVGIGSVAQSRPRSKNTVYAASKSALEFFFSGLSQRLHGTKCRIQYYRVGYMKTGMTFGRRSMVPYAAPAKVARRIVQGLKKDGIGVYVPRWWGALMLAYKLLPGFIFRRLKI